MCSYFASVPSANYFLLIHYFKKKTHCMKHAVLVASLFLVVAAVSCKKDDDNDELTTFQLITSATWSIDSVGWDMDNNGQIDGAAPVQACDVDNTITFSSDSTGVVDEGATKCNTANPQTVPFEWTLNDSTKVLFMTGNIPSLLSGEVRLVNVTNDNLTLSKRITTDFPTPFDGYLLFELKK